MPELDPHVERLVADAVNQGFPAKVSEPSVLVRVAALLSDVNLGEKAA